MPSIASNASNTQLRLTLILRMMSIIKYPRHVCNVSLKDEVPSFWQTLRTSLGAATLRRGLRSKILS